MGGKANGVGLNTLGTNPTPAQYMDFIQSGALSKWSDTSKTAFNNYLLGYNYNQNQIDIANKANEHEIDMWRMNNEYNTPANQMKRLIEAGLNPALAYSQLDAGNASSAPGTHMPDQQIPNSTQFHDTQDRLAMSQLVLRGVSDFVSQFNDTINTLYSLPEQKWKNESAQWDAEMSKEQYTSLNLAYNSIVHKDSPLYNTYKSDPNFAMEPVGDGLYVVKDSLRNPLVASYVKNLLSYLQAKDTRQWYQDYRAHANTMFADEEATIKYNAEMKKWLTDYKNTLPPKYRYIIDMVEGVFQFAQPFMLNYQTHKLMK